MSATDADATARPIYINGRFYAQRLSGVQRYGIEIVRQLNVLASERGLAGRLRLLLPSGVEAPRQDSIEVINGGIGSGHLWTQTWCARSARDGVLLSLAASGPLMHPRHLCVIHDAAVFRHPEFYSRRYVLIHRAMDRVLARTARIGTVSQFSRNELSAMLGLDRESIVVAGNGSEHLALRADETVIDRIPLAGRPFFLLLGSPSPNKNVAVAIRALARLEGKGLMLVAVGDLDAGVFAAKSVNSEWLIRAGRLSDAEIAGLMRHARALIFPSIYEGFGIPPLEAMMHGCPVLASTAEAVREVCGDAADYFDPHDDEALADLMNDVLAEGASRRAARQQRGRERAASYRWRDSAAVILDTCLELAATGVRPR